MRHWTRYAAPARFAPLVRPWLPWLWAACLVSALAGLAVGLVLAPTDAQQGQSYRILYIHGPAAWMSMLLYLVMAFWAAVGWVWRVRLAFMLARAVAPTGALFTGIALLSGALWGQPTWGTWWVWDARLTSELVLLFLYIGFMALHSAIDDVRRADRAAGLLAIVGVVNLPIIYFSVQWWNTLHQGASITLNKAPSMATPMLLGMLVMALAAWMYTIAVTLARVRIDLLERERHTAWVRKAIA